MEEFQFSRSFDLRKLCNSLCFSFYESFDHQKILIYPVASENFTTLDKTLVRTFSWKFDYALCTSVASVFIELQNLFPSENDRTRLIFARPRVVLTRNCNFKMAVDLFESKLYMWKFIFLHNFGWGIRIYFHLSTKVNR